MAVYHPAQCTERETNGDEDCTWCTGVMLRNAEAGATVAPPTRAEYEALRVAGGDGPAENPGDGSNYGQMADGMEVRYGRRPTVFGGLRFEQAWSVLEPGVAMGWQGSMGAVTPHLRRWDPRFKGAHSALVIRDDSQDRVWWMNPQAPNSYPGEYISKNTLRAYFEGLPQRGRAVALVLVGASPPDTSTGGNDMRYVMADGYAVDSGLRINVGKGARWLYLDGSPGGVFSDDGVLVVAGLGDSTTGQYIVRTGTGAPYADKVTRDTLVLLRSKNKPYPAPKPPAANCDAAVNAALDHVKGAVTGVTIAIQEARPR